MNTILELLQTKNHYLENFYSLNEKELINFKNGNFDNLNYFYSVREGILKNISYLDSLMEKSQNESKFLSEDERKKINLEIKVKEEYVKRIIETDVEILSYIDAAKSEIINELKSIKKARQGVSGYKLGSMQKREIETV